MSENMLKNGIKDRIITIYTDGGCHNENGNMKGIGAWAFAVYDEDNTDDITVYAQRVVRTTNNRTEMMAVINAISFCEPGSKVKIISDSGYVVKGYTDPAYLDRWVSNGWKTSGNKQVSNIDLWQKILGLSYHYILQFQLIRGHMKDKNHIHAYWNSIVDKACTKLMNIEYDGIVKMTYDTKAKSFNIELEVL